MGSGGRARLQSMGCCCLVGPRPHQTGSACSRGIESTNKAFALLLPLYVTGYAGRPCCSYCHHHPLFIKDFPFKLWIYCMSKMSNNGRYCFLKVGWNIFRPMCAYVYFTFKCVPNNTTITVTTQLFQIVQKSS